MADQETTNGGERKPEKPSEPSEVAGSFGKLKFKPLHVTHDMPVDFWERPASAGVDDEEEPLILEVSDVNEGVPVRAKCIVCYKGILENDTDLFTCPNCGREAHYLCATIFITEHGICPVCSTRIEIDPDTGKYVSLGPI